MKNCLKMLFSCLFACVVLAAYTVGGFKAEALADSGKVIYLTFDDGPSKITNSILDTLKEQNIKATFFVVGNQAKDNPDILKRIRREGHLIGIHSQTHIYSEIYKSPATLLSDIENCRMTIADILGGYDDYIYRFPGGSFGLRGELKSAVSAAGYKYYDWNASNLDAELKNPDAGALLDSAITTGAGRNNIIMLMHDAQNKRLTAEALPDIICYYKNKGYQFKMLSNKKSFFVKLYGQL